MMVVIRWEEVGWLWVASYKLLSKLYIWFALNESRYRHLAKLYSLISLIILIMNFHYLSSFRERIPNSEMPVPQLQLRPRHQADTTWTWKTYPRNYQTILYFLPRPHLEQPAVERQKIYRRPTNRLIENEKSPNYTSVFWSYRSYGRLLEGSISYSGPLGRRDHCSGPPSGVHVLRKRYHLFTVVDSSVLSLAVMAGHVPCVVTTSHHSLVVSCRAGRAANEIRAPVIRTTMDI